MIDKLIQYQIKYSKILLLLLIIVMSFFTYVATDLQIDPDFKTLVPDDSDFNTNDRIIKNAFGVDDAIVIFITKDRNTLLTNVPVDMQDERVSMYLDEIQESLTQSQYVESIVGPYYSDNFDSVQLVARLSSPEIVGSTKIITEEFDLILNQVGSPVGTKTIVTGFPVVLDKIPTFLIKDNLNTIIITLVAIFLILFFYSRDIYFTLITMSVPVFSLVTLAAAMVFLNINITITLAAVAVLTLGLGADYSIHIATHYSKARKDLGSHTKAMIQTAKQLQLPITASFITTLAGFSALIFGVSPSSQAQGIVLALGITIIYLLTFSMFPVLMTIFSNHINVRPNIVFEKIFSFLGTLAVYQTKYAKAIIWLVLILTGVMMYGASQVKFSTSNSNWIPDDDEVITANREVETAFGGRDERIQLILISEQGDLRDVQVQRDVNKLKAQLEGIPIVDFVSTPYDGLDYDSNELHEELTFDNLRRSQFNKDFTLTTITLSSKNPGQDEAGDSVLLGEIRNILKTNDIYNTQISLYGNIVRFEELGDNLENDAAVTTLLGFGLVFFVASVVYASIAIGLLALGPILMAIIWAVGLMGFFNVPFTSLSTGIISLVLGIGVDFSIHLVDSIKKYSKRMPFNTAVFETMNTSGKAIFISSFTTLVGFMALTFARLLGTQRLGWSLGFSIISVFVVSMLFVPSVMSILHKRKLRKIKRKELKIRNESII